LVFTISKTLRIYKKKKNAPKLTLIHLFYYYFFYEKKLYKPNSDTTTWKRGAQQPVAEPGIYLSKGGIKIIKYNDK